LDQPLRQSAHSATIVEEDFTAPYVAAITRLRSRRHRPFRQRFAIDAMYGAGAGILAGISAPRHPLRRDPRQSRSALSGINPEPIEPHVRALQDTVVAEKCQLDW